MSSRQRQSNRQKDAARRREEDRRANAVILRRGIFLMVLLGVVTFAILLVKLFDLQIIQHEELEAKALAQQTRSMSVSASRGTIYDSQGQVLAMSATVQNVVLSPKDIAEKEMDKNLIAGGLSRILHVPRATILEKMENTSLQYVIVKRQVESGEEEAVRQFISENGLATGVYLEPTTKRYYPYGTLASHVIGFVGTENTGLYGTEAYYEDTLQGTAGRVITAKTGAGTEMLYKYEQYFDAEEGEDIYLTIDSTIQYYCESILAEGIQKFEVQNGGVCIAMDPNTGAVLGMANSPNYDLSNFSAVISSDLLATLDGLEGDEYNEALGEAQMTQWRNRAVMDPYEPGSTFKTVVLAMALEEGVVSLDDTFYCSGSVRVADWNISCSYHRGHGTQNLTQAVCNSCNPAFIAIGQRVGADRFYQYMEDFGLLELTGIDMQSEAEGIVWTRDYFTGIYGLTSLAVASFGQTMKFTPISLIRAYAACINGGYVLEPYVVDRVVDADGNTVRRHETTVVRQVISEETSATVRSILETNVSKGGTGKNAYVAGYRIGGKTGTSEKRDENTGNNIVSFMGFAPANDPKVIVLLCYDSPKQTAPGSNVTAGGYYISGGNMAAPMAGKLLAEICDYMGVDKQYTSSELAVADVTMPQLIGGTVTGATDILSRKNLTLRTVGGGSMITDQIPAAGTVIPSGSQVIIYLGAEKPTDPITVPNVLGLSPDAAARALTNQGLYMRVAGATSGSGYSSVVAIGQSVKPYSQVARGTVVEVRFADRSMMD